jgi:phage terminase large subunit-like protein
VNENLHVGVETWSGDDAVLEVAAFVSELAEKYVIVEAVLGRLVHPDDPELNAHVHAAVAKHSRRGWRLDKPDRSSKIDAVVALAMAVERQAFQPEPVQVAGWL